MPVVFSPGEAETRPLDPTAIVYTSGDKVGDLLGIAAGEPVIAAADASATGFFVSGADLREHGFESGDSIFVYSDLDPVGLTFTLDATNGVISDSGNVKLVTTVATPANYTTAANTMIQNKAIFTNGKSRGVTKDIVNTRIREIQDRIDNITHNAWRPYLVVAEYINFDTYKPYRRRYYTDYVGTAPLLFRNVQQVLRIELWQGDDYREIGSAEARLQINKDTFLDTNDFILLSPGAGGFAKLDVGTGTRKWDASFDSVASAQNLADLINKEDRVGRDTVSFDTANPPLADGPTFTLPVASGNQNVYVHNEFLATANSDYGNGKLKITSMRQTKGGEEATIAVSDTTNLVVSQTKTVTGTGTFNSAGKTMTFADSSGFAQYGTLLIGSTVAFYTGNNGTTLTSVETIGVSLGNGSYECTQHRFKSDIGAFSDAGGDQARLKDWWLDHEMGIIYFNNSYPFFEWNAVKVSYIYGERYLEQAIEEAATKLVASELLMSDDRSVLIPEGTQNVDLGSKIQLWRKEAMEILGRYKEVVVFS